MMRPTVLIQLVMLDICARIPRRLAPKRRGNLVERCRPGLRLGLASLPALPLSVITSRALIFCSLIHHHPLDGLALVRFGSGTLLFLFLCAV